MKDAPEPVLHVAPVRGLLDRRADWPVGSRDRPKAASVGAGDEMHQRYENGDEDRCAENPRNDDVDRLDRSRIPISRRLAADPEKAPENRAHHPEKTGGTRRLGLRIGGTRGGHRRPGTPEKHSTRASAFRQGKKRAARHSGLDEAVHRRSIASFSQILRPATVVPSRGFCFRRTMARRRCFFGLKALPASPVCKKITQGNPCA